MSAEMLAAEQVEHIEIRPPSNVQSAEHSYLIPKESLSLSNNMSNPLTHLIQSTIHPMYNPPTLLIQSIHPPMYNPYSIHKESLSNPPSNNMSNLSTIKFPYPYPYQIPQASSSKQIKQQHVRTTLVCTSYSA